MLKRFDSLDFDVLDYRGYFGHAYYCRIPVLHRLEAEEGTLACFSSHGPAVQLRNAYCSQTADGADV